MRYNKEDDEARYKAFIIHPLLSLSPSSQALSSSSERDVKNQIEEIEGLARAIDLDILDIRTAGVRRINPGHFFGKGIREEVASTLKALTPDVVIVNHNLSPVQQRNLEKAWHAKIIDRTGLILEIFGERAQTREGKIQVDLAALEYQRSRLVRSWTHLERQRGGAGFMGGPGERQIELDRRIIGDKITKLKKELEDVRRTRDLARQSRERIPFPVVALVGYTNAGKSTLFNHMTGADVFAKDLLFATLDPTMRKVKPEKGREFILSDTVGFISDLPTHLVAAFRATLEQVQYADIILHVRDIAQKDSESQRQDVIDIMEDLGIEYDTDRRIIEVLNKIDLLGEDERTAAIRKAKFDDQILALSALSGEGVAELLAAIDSHLTRSRIITSFKLDIKDGKALSWLYDHGKIIDRKDDRTSITVQIEITPEDSERFSSQFEYREVVT